MPVNPKELLPAWTFWNVGSHWFGRRACGKEKVRAGTYVMVLAKAGWKEDELKRNAG